MAKQTTPQADLGRIIDSAKRLGVEMDEEEALQWLTAMAALPKGNEVVFDTRSGVFGQGVTMLDFSQDELEHFRNIGRIIEFLDIPGQVETALALSGSSAQSKIQSFPGDCDYFERVNIKAPTRADATQVLGKIMREKALSKLKAPNYQLIEVKLGSYPFEAVKDGVPVKVGAPISWQPDEIVEGKIDLFLPDGTPATVTWDEAASEPGWCKLDWVVADPVHKYLVNASNMLDVTWEAPDGAIAPLDGYLDPYFQEVYLEADSMPIFAKLAKHVDADALDNYVLQLEKEVHKYLTRDINYGKVAKRMYNIFRLTGRFSEAAFLRELFDEPATVLYQVWSLIRTLDDAVRIGTEFPKEQLMQQTDTLTMGVIQALEGDQEAEIVRYLFRLKDAIALQEGSDRLNTQCEAARAEVINIVNNFFYERLTAVPTIKDYMDGVQK
jgi:hypothetical protein